MTTKVKKSKTEQIKKTSNVEQKTEQQGIDINQLLMELYNNLAGQIFHLNDINGDLEGIILTSCPEDVLEKLWNKFYHHDPDDGDTEEGDDKTFGELEVKPDGTDWMESYDAEIFTKFLRKLGYVALKIDKKEIEV